MKEKKVSVFFRLRKDPLAVISGIVFLLIVLACIFAPLITAYDYTQLDINHKFLDPSAEHLMGTDQLGRDLFTRMLYGGRITLRVTLIGTLIALLGIPCGLLSGYFGKKTDAFMSRSFDAVSVLPPLLLIILAEAVLGYGKGYFQFALGVAFMPPLFRLTRTLTMKTAGKEFIEAARALGVDTKEIITKHVLRNIAPALITQTISTFSDILLYCTIVGYLEIGFNPPTPEWGQIIRDMFDSIMSHPTLVLTVTAVVPITLLSLNLFGKGLRDAFAADRRTN